MGRASANRSPLHPALTKAQLLSGLGTFMNGNELTGQIMAGGLPLLRSIATHFKAPPEKRAKTEDLGENADVNYHPHAFGVVKPGESPGLAAMH